MKYYLYLLIILLCSCRSPLKVTVISDVTEGPNTIIFDNKDTLITNKTVDSIFLSPFRNHQFTVNNGKPQDFFLRHDEGMLNLTKREFVVLQTEYENEEGEDGQGLFSHEIHMEKYVLIDSFIIGDQGINLKNRVPLKEIVDSLKFRKNGNFQPLLDKRFPTDVDDYDRSEEVDGFKKIGNKELFIKKYWDYNIGDSIPGSIKVRIRESDLKYKNNVRKTFITFADNFLFFARMSKKKYYVVDVRDLLKDKVGHN